MLGIKRKVIFKTPPCILGADITKDDGVYSRYFTKFSGNGRYSVRIEVSGKGTLKTYQHPTNTDGFLLEDNLHPGEYTLC